MIHEKLNDLDLHFLRQREDHAATQGFLGGMALGILLGVVIALVFAPRRGDETRAAVANTAVAVKDKAVGLVSQQTGTDGIENATGADAVTPEELLSEGGSPTI